MFVPLFIKNFFPILEFGKTRPHTLYKFSRSLVGDPTGFSHGLNPGVISSDSQRYVYPEPGKEFLQGSNDRFDEVIRPALVSDRISPVRVVWEFFVLQQGLPVEESTKLRKSVDRLILPLSRQPDRTCPGSRGYGIRQLV